MNECEESKQHHSLETDLNMLPRTINKHSKRVGHDLSRQANSNVKD